MITSRRNFFSAAFGLPAATHARPTAAKRTPLLDFAVAGGAYHALHQWRDRLQPGDRLHLRRERDNPHDRCAVAVETGSGVKLGYVPASGNGAVAALIDAGRTLEAVVVDHFDFRRLLAMSIRWTAWRSPPPMAGILGSG